MGVTAGGRAGLIGRAAGAALATVRVQAPAPEGPFSRFDRAVDALNRLPRPVFAFGTVALFAAAMLVPEAFAARMAALSAMPEPMWWLLGGVVSFHFGAREAYYFRSRGTAGQPMDDTGALPGDEAPNAALDDLRGRG